MCIFSNLGAYRRMYTGYLPIVYAVMPGLSVPLATRNLGTHLLQKRFIQSFSSRMVKRVGAYRQWVRVGLTLKKIAEHP